MKIEIQNLTKTYSGGFKALDDVSLTITDGMFGLLGPNGAGKSTTIGIICSLINKTSGKVSVYDVDLDKDPAAARMHIGLVPQEFNFNIFEPVGEILINQAGYYGLPRKLARERAEKYLNKLGLWDRRYDMAKELSGGMKRRLNLCMGLLHEPKFLLLDEPTVGIDPQARLAILEVIREAAERAQRTALEVEGGPELGIAIAGGAAEPDHRVLLVRLETLELEVIALGVDGQVPGAGEDVAPGDLVKEEALVVEDEDARILEDRARDGDELFIFTNGDSYKVKRLRRNPRIRIAECGARGALKGPWHEGTGRIVEDEAGRQSVLQALRTGRAIGANGIVIL